MLLIFSVIDETVSLLWDASEMYRVLWSKEVRSQVPSQTYTQNAPSCLAFLLMVLLSHRNDPPDFAPLLHQKSNSFSTVLNWCLFCLCNQFPLLSKNRTGVYFLSPVGTSCSCPRNLLSLYVDMCWQLVVTQLRNIAQYLLMRCNLEQDKTTRELSSIYYCTKI